jgi:hypothetical protein
MYSSHCQAKPYTPEDRMAYSIEELEEMMMDGVFIIEECGCPVEPDGTCPCGNESPLLEMGMI